MAGRRSSLAKVLDFASLVLLCDRLYTSDKVQVGFCCAVAEAGRKTVAIVCEKLVVVVEGSSSATAATIERIATLEASWIAGHGAAAPGLLDF